jgi:hypothetical protein
MRCSNGVDVQHNPQLKRNLRATIVRQFFPKNTLKTTDNVAQRVACRDWRVLDAKYLGALLIGYAADKCDVQFRDSVD